MAYYVTAKEKGRSYRVTVSKALSKDKAEELKSQMIKQNRIAIPKYRIFTEIKVEERK